MCKEARDGLAGDRSEGIVDEGFREMRHGATRWRRWQRSSKNYAERKEEE